MQFNIERINTRDDSTRAPSLLFLAIAIGLPARLRIARIDWEETRLSQVSSELSNEKILCGENCTFVLVFTVFGSLGFR
ncbi:hypothetical protein BDV34DRAFT_194148 [Aspergillus parasiticus]|uniref:Uncharacterized protein n=1 Tax=Aspergillus parasiticus TaxID=5067 RepID=A0A5N6DP38_ASPPA|nr:hypothetical protein BDV34DRAFT_194148 [Aspergillus parasiticus]